jgi:hypothetical protein
MKIIRLDNMSILETVNEALSKFYSPFEYLALEKVIVPFRGRVVSNSIFQKEKKKKHLDVKMYKLCDSTGYTYGMKVYF